MAITYTFKNTAEGFGQFEDIAPASVADVGDVDDVIVTLNSGVPRGQVEKVLRKAIKLASATYVPG